MTDTTMLEKIYIKYAALRAEAKEDCAWDKTKLDATGFNVTMCISKWINKKCEWNMKSREFEMKRLKIYRQLYDFYDTESPKKLSTKTEYELFITSDSGYVNCFNESATIKEVVEYIESVIKLLKDKQWEVKNYVEYQKFINGR